MLPVTSLRELLGRISCRRFLVVGDLYLDSYIFGQPARVSREAPIMVLEETRREERLGGGTAPALALAALGASVRQVGVVGADPEGERVEGLLEESGIDICGVLTDPDRPTTVKTRIVAEGAFNVFPQQVSRIDRQDRALMNGDLRGQLAGIIREASRDVDAIILSDYRSGVVTPEVVEAVRNSTALGTVDSQGALRDFAGLDLVKCNRAEAETVLGVVLSDRTMREQQLTALRTELETDRLIVTLGPAGAAISSISLGYREVPPLVHQQVFDVTGAGDTVIAVLTGAIAAGGDDLAALQLSQVAAGLVIAKWGNAQATKDEIIAALNESDGNYDA
jgi:D-glycero-beta-D-manno-heptose-7-phosphate kinase